MLANLAFGSKNAGFHCPLAGELIDFFNSMFSNTSVARSVLKVSMTLLALWITQRGPMSMFYVEMLIVYVAANSLQEYSSF